MNKKIAFIVFLAFATVMFLSGCTKNDNMISGTISYKTDLTGEEFLAEGADVYLMFEGSDTEYLLKTTTDENGNYILYPVEDGNYYISSEFTNVLSFHYGVSALFEVKGKDDITVDLVLE
jgi:hypothetical protein